MKIVVNQLKNSLVNNGKCPPTINRENIFHWLKTFSSLILSNSSLCLLFRILNDSD